MQKPLLSIGMIFKNEIRCLERCMRSLEPLRQAVSCELVMADTGSDDGSRKIAEKYADIVFDFPWIDDFSAARNAVMDRCSGTWYFSIDADEWLDENIEELVSFLQADRPFQMACLYIYNYKTAELDKGGVHVDFIATRFLRLATKIRYEGIVHECWMSKSGEMLSHLLETVILHHDGYLSLDHELMARKGERNRQLLEKTLEKTPNDLRCLLQCLENGDAAAETLVFAQRALDNADSLKWKLFGAPIIRRAVQICSEAKLPELEEWIHKAEMFFPDSLFTRIDVAYYGFSKCFNQDDYAGSAYYGEMYLQALKEYRSGKYQIDELQYSVIHLCDSAWERKLRIYLAEVYRRIDRLDDAISMLDAVDATELRPEQTADFIKILRNIHSKTRLDTSSLIRKFWQQLNLPKPTEEWFKKCQEAFLQAASKAFLPQNIHGEKANQNFCRYSYTLLIPLAENCELGTAAAILETEDRAELEKLLGMVEKWEEFPIYALEHALLEGIRFPLPGKPLKIEEMDTLAARMARPGGPLAGLAVLAADETPSDWQALAWARGLALAAVRSCDWTDEQQGMDLCRAFSKIEDAFLPKYYASNLLCDENIFILPPMHRFGWYCGKAFWALDAGDSAAYVRLLRQGLEVCPEGKPMVEFLLRQLEESRKVQSTPELLTLAEQVRALLAQYPADDPAVEALKQSAAYQKVAHLIEGPELGVFGGIGQ